MNVQHAPTAMTESRERHNYARVPGRWLLLARGIWIALVVLTLAIFVVSLLFPTGRFVPHWMRWTLVVFVAGLVPEIFVAPVLPHTPVDQLGFFIVIGEGAALVLIQLYRYRRVSSPLQRQQTKWVVFGFAV